MRLKSFVKEVGGTTSDLFNLPLSVLRPNPNNIRLDTAELREHIRSIAESIKATGYLRSEPFTIRLVDGDFAEVVNGNCRFAACQIALAEGAELLTVPCMLEAPGTTEADRVANMVVANSGLLHSPLEMTAAVKRLLSFGWNEGQIAKRWGKSRQYISNLLELGGAPADIHAAITNGTVSATQAIKLIRSEGADAGAVIAKVAEQARAAGKSKGDGKVRITAKSFEAAKPPAQPKAPDPIWATARIDHLRGAAQEILRIWDAGAIGSDFDEAMRALREAVA